MINKTYMSKLEGLVSRHKKLRDVIMYCKTRKEAEEIQEVLEDIEEKIKELIEKENPDLFYLLSYVYNFVI